MRRPFWLPASNYYVLAAAICLAFFFVVWAILDDIDGMRAPWQTAGVSASIVLVGSVVLRGIMLRRWQAYLRQPAPARVNDRHKLTIERSATIMAEIMRKSEAANILDTIASGHREVYEMCAAFLHRIDTELATVQAASPRLAALLRSRNRASELHKFHTLRWAQIEARTLSTDARSLPEPSQRIHAARQAIAVVDEALVTYPAEEALIESRALLNELAVSIKVANAVEKAEHAVSRGDFTDAKRAYNEALSYLANESMRTPERDHAMFRIREAIERLSFPTNNG